MQYHFISAELKDGFVLITARMHGQIIKIKYVGYTIEMAKKSFENNFITIQNFN